MRTFVNGSGAPFFVAPKTKILYIMLQLQNEQAPSLQKVVCAYNGNPIQFVANGNVKVNATEMARSFGEAKHPKHWLNNQSTKEFINELSKVRNLTLIDLVQVRHGGSNPGTWFHEDVAIEFARWLAPAFAIWCNDKIKWLLSNRTQPQKQLDYSYVEQMKARLEDYRQKAIAYRADLLKKSGLSQPVCDVMVYKWRDDFTLEQNLDQMMVFLFNNTLAGWWATVEMLKRTRELKHEQGMRKLYEGQYNTYLNLFNSQCSIAQKETECNGKLVGILGSLLIK